MSNIVSNQKSLLAKLMATENLMVEHAKTQTARFDMKNRVLTLPIWKDMSGHLYDHLVGHEVGHALDTPLQGWHDSVVDPAKGKSYKTFLNVIEDARIEKRQKRRYPGLRLSFQKGFENLMERDFFGLEGRDVNSMSFIDRLNIFTKSQYTADVQFNDMELQYIERVKKLETWDDVVRLTDEIYQYSKDEQFETYMEQLQGFEADEDGDYEFEQSDEGEPGDEETEGTQSGNKSEDSDEDADGEQGESEEESEDGDEQSESKNQSKNRFKDSNPAEYDMFAPNCETDENYRENETQLLDDKSREYKYLDLPKPNMAKLVTPAKIVHKNLKKHFDECIVQEYFTESNVREWIQDFKTKNEKYINLLVKEFEMRKAAKTFSKAKMADTGDLDLNKLATYKFDDNIFRKVMLTPKGKNHGMILLLDKSGSMSDNMAGSIEQILILTMFCRKVNIPFHVYGFTDSIDVIIDDEQYDRGDYDSIRKVHKTEFFEKKENNMAFKTVRLREYLHSGMSNTEFSQAVRNMVLIRKCFEHGGRRSVIPRPLSEYLSNTPLNQAIYTCGFVMKDFKKKHALDLASLVIVHDGESDNTNAYWSKINGDYRHMFLLHVDVNIIRDKKNHFEARANEYGNMTEVIQKWFKHVTGGAKIFGFYLTPNRSVTNAIHWYHKVDGKSLSHPSHRHNSSFIVSDLRKKFMKEKFLACDNSGFDGFYLIAGGADLVVNNDELQITGEVTVNKLKTAFMKMNKSKAVNRVLVTTFISKMATQ
jgi:hypothetical protein